MNAACPNQTEPREQLDTRKGVGSPDTLGAEVTREQIIEALNALRRDLDETTRRLAALERRVAAQEQRRAAEARGGVR